MKRILAIAWLAALLCCRLSVAADESSEPAKAAVPPATAISADGLFADWEASRRAHPASAYSAAKELLNRFPQDARAAQVQPWTVAYEKVVAEATARAETGLAATAVATDGTRYRVPAARIADCTLHLEYAFDTIAKYVQVDIDLRKVDPRTVATADNQYWQRVTLTSRRYEPSCEATDYAKTGSTEAPAPGGKIASARYMACLIVVKDSPAAAAALRTATEACQPAALAEEMTPEQAKERIVGILMKEASFSPEFLQTVYVVGESLHFDGCTLKARFRTRVSGLVRPRNDLMDYVIPFDLVDPGTTRPVQKGSKKAAALYSLNGSKVIGQDLSYNEGSFEHPVQGQTWSKDFDNGAELVVDSMETAARLSEAVFHLAKACNASARAAK